MQNAEMCNFMQTSVDRTGSQAYTVSHGRQTTPTKDSRTVSYTHLRAHETDSYLVCRLLLEKKKKIKSV